MAAPSSETLGQRLRSLRENNGLSLREVAKRSGLNSGYLSQLERDAILNPTPVVLQKVADGYDRPFGLVMRWAGYIEDDPDSLSPNAQRALSVLGEDFTDDELKAMRAVLDAIRTRNRATFAGHRTDLVLDEFAKQEIRRQAVGVVRELGVLDSAKRVDMEEAFLVAKLVQVGEIELTLDEKRRLRKHFHGLVDWSLNQLQGLIHLDRGVGGEVFLNPSLEKWERKKRFVMGHEAAHAVLEHHRKTFAYLEDKRRLRPDIADIYEREANQFSIELLAKGDRLREEFDDSPPDIGRMDVLSQDYGISFDATSRRLAEDSRQPVAIVVAYRADKGAGDLLASKYKLWCSESFEERMGWRVGPRPDQDIYAALRLVAAGGVPGPMFTTDREGLPVQVSVEAKDFRHSAHLLLSCLPRPRLNLRRANPFSRRPQQTPAA